MPWPVHDSWNQHLDELNSRAHSRALEVELVRIEGPFANPSRHIRHVHPYWQMSVVRNKGFSVELDKDLTLAPEAGDIMFIPPQNWHYFNFPNGKDAWTLKFTLARGEEKFPPGILPVSGSSRLLHRWLSELLQQKTESDDSGNIILEHLIAAALDLHFHGQDIGGSETELIREARLFIEEQQGQGFAVKAGDVSAHLKLSTAYLTRIFKAQLGVPLKVYIDQQRFDLARKLMAFSDHNLSEIASELGFDDVFRFSRFFKRMSGVCPSAYTSLK